jgi:hypothetical protein
MKNYSFLNGKYSRGSPHCSILFNFKKINRNLYKESEYTTNQPPEG